MTLQKSAAAALGVTMLFQLRVDEPLIDPKHLAVYHWTASANRLFFPAMADFLLCWMFLLALLLLAERLRRLRIVVWCSILLFTPWIVVKTVPVFYPQAALHTFASCCLYGGLPLGLGLLVFWRTSWDAAARCGIEFLQTVFGFGAAGGVLLLVQLVFCVFAARNLNRPPALLPHPGAAAARPAHGRVIWIVFDELSHHQLYEHRFQGLALPAFDALAAQSTVFTRVVPAGLYTERILPSLITGSPVQDVRSSAGGDLLTRQTQDARWTSFDPHDTVFQDALGLGYRTGVAGWFNPYCRILAPVLHECSWRYDTALDNGMAPDASMTRNMLQPLVAAMENDRVLQLLVPFLGHFLGTAKYNTPSGRGHIGDYQTLLQSADRLLDDPHMDFLLLHLPVPHPQGIYNRRTGRLTASGSSYLDNLALADRCLAELMQRLRDHGQFDSSTIVLMGDHSWRTMLLWRGSNAWTREEELASGAGFDERPAYMVKLPNQHIPGIVDTPFSAQRTRSLLDALLADGIPSKEDLSAWAVHPTSYTAVSISQHDAQDAGLQQ